MKNPIQLTKAIASSRAPFHRPSLRRDFFLSSLVVALASCALSLTRVQAECREGCSEDLNTFLGENALFSNTTGISNVAGGNGVLYYNTTGSYNTANGAEALENNQTGSDNTASGYAALFNNTTGHDNTASGYQSLFYNNGTFNTASGVNALFVNTTGSDNTALGFQALYSNTTASKNTATGYTSLYSNTTGDSNTAGGYAALYSNTTGNYNTANGYAALYGNTTGGYNTANGYAVLYKNTTGGNNTGAGFKALFSNNTGSNNMANGFQALYSNTTGVGNTAEGLNALYKNTTGGSNTAIGITSLNNNTTGSGNIALGNGAGVSLSTGSNNIDIGNSGVAGEASTIRIGKVGTQTNTYIAGIYGVTASSGVGVFIDSSGHLGTATSSARFKDEIKPMEKASEAILALQPVTFRYKHELDPDGIPQFGLVAEQVAKVNPDLVARDNQGKPYTVRYEAVNAMLLNEFLKEHRRVEELQATVAQQQSANTEQQKEIKALAQALKEQAAQIQKISLRSAGDETAPRVVSND